MKPSKIHLVQVALLLVAVSGCGTGDDRLREKARIEGAEAAETQVNAETRSRDERVRQMEIDLERRHRFFDAITGNYEGIMLTPEGTDFGVRFAFSPSLPRYPRSGRPRSIEELTFDLNNLYVNAHVVEWSKPRDGDRPDMPEIAFGCVYEQIRPDIKRGRIVLSSSQCKATYTLYISYRGSKGKRQAVAQALASKVAKGNLTSISAILGEKQTVFTSRKFAIAVSKQEE